MKSVFKGSCVALVTPFKDGKVDYEALKNLIEFQIENGTSAVVVLGTTGEPSTMSKEEKDKVISFSKSVIKGRIKLIVGTGSNCTEEAVENSKSAKELGADALLVVTPYYNKCTQKGLVEHYKTIAKNCDLPIIVYNVPGRTGVNILPETMLKLSKIPQICGIKEASGSINQIMRVCKLLKNKLAVYSGDDSLNYVFMTLGAEGVISVTANILPKEVCELTKLSLNGEYKKAKSIQDKLFNINELMFVEVNPIPVKKALHLMGKIENELRLPLLELSKSNTEKLKKELLKLKV